MDQSLCVYIIKLNKNIRAMMVGTTKNLQHNISLIRLKIHFKVSPVPYISRIEKLNTQMNR